MDSAVTAALNALKLHCQEATKSLEEDLIKACLTEDDVQSIRATITRIESWIIETPSPSIDMLEQKQKELEKVCLPLFNKVLDMNAGYGVMIGTGFRNYGCDIEVKVLMVGESGVGKSSLLTRFLTSYLFSADQKPTNRLYYETRVNDIDGQRVKLEIWDTPGKDGYKSLSSKELIGADGVIVIFDITDRKSYDNIKTWLLKLKKFFPQIPLVLVGNKCDENERRVVTVDNAEQFAVQNGISEYIETTAKENEGVDQIFKSIGRLILLEKKAKKVGQEGSSLEQSNVV